MVGFLQAQNCSNYPASWRHAESASDFMTPAYYGRIARALEDGKFHLAFFDDRLAMPDIYGADHGEAVRNGVRVVKMDPVPILSTMAMGTKCGPRRDLFDDLLRAVPYRADVHDAGSYDWRGLAGMS